MYLTYLAMDLVTCETRKTIIILLIYIFVICCHKFSWLLAYLYLALPFKIYSNASEIQQCQFSRSQEIYNKVLHNLHGI